MSEKMYMPAWHLSVQKHGPKLRQRQARLHQLDDAAEPSGEPGGSASGDFPRLIGGTFFARGRVVNGVPLAGGHRDVEGHDKDQAVGVAELGILDAEAARLEVREHRLDAPALRILKGPQVTGRFGAFRSYEACSSRAD